MTRLFRLALRLGVIACLLSSCIYRGSYSYGGAFPNVQLPAEGKTIGVLDPRGAFGDKDARNLLHKSIKKSFGSCTSLTLLTEDNLNERGKLPAIFGDQLSESNLRWFVEQTELDYLILPKVGPGSLQDLPGSFNDIPADREASVRIIVYDLTDGGELKSITVNGRLNLKEEKKIWELEASEENIGLTALRKALKRLGKLTDCG